MYNALSALGEVARDNSDRGMIAVLNEYGYRHEGRVRGSREGRPQGQ